MQLEDVVAAGDERLVAALDGHDVVGQAGSAQLVQGDVQYLGLLAHLGAYQDEGAAAEFPPLAHPAHADGGHDLLGGQHFGVDERVHAQLLEEFLVLGQQVFVVVDAGHGLLRAQVGGQQAGRHVAAFVGGDGDEEVGVFHAHFLQPRYRRGRGVDGHQVEVRPEGVELVLVFVHEDDVLLLAREQLGQMCAYCAGTGNDNFHFCNG